MYIYVYLCNELIEETARRRKLIFGMWGSFGYGSSSSELRAKCRLIMDKIDIFRDDISLIINQCHLQATEGSLPRTRSVCQPRSASKRSALVYIYIYIYIYTLIEF